MTGTVTANADAAKQRPRWKIWGKWILIVLGVLTLAFVGRVVWMFNQTRVCPVVPPGATGQRIQTDSILANYFPGRGAGRRPAVVVIGGYEGGLGNEAKREALLLQAAGFRAQTHSQPEGDGGCKGDA